MQSYRMKAEDIFGKKRLLLASGSPRRRELIEQLGMEVVRAHLKDVEETYPDTLSAAEVAPYLSRLKAEAYMGEIAPDEVLLTADTVVVDGDRILGKPRDEGEAHAMLRELSGHTHQVITGVTLASDKGMQTFSEVTEVEFAELTDDEISYYVEKYRPLDKAGAYGIQEWIGYIGIKGIKGDYYNVMGLPLRRVYEHLLKM